jgi:hypothetical protein
MLVLIIYLLDKQVYKMIRLTIPLLPTCLAFCLDIGERQCGVSKAWDAAVGTIVFPVDDFHLMGKHCIVGLFQFSVKSGLTEVVGFHFNLEHEFGGQKVEQDFGHLFYIYYVWVAFL